MRIRRHRYSIPLLVLAFGIVACQGDTSPTGPVPNEPIVQSDPSPPGGNDSQAGDRENDPGGPSSSSDDLPSDDDQPDAGSDAGNDGSDTSEKEPRDPDAEGPSDTAIDPDEDLMAALAEELDQELAELSSQIPRMTNRYLSLLATWTTTLLQSSGELLACTPLPYAFDADIIGPAGGMLVVGNHTVSIPAGALDRPIVIVAQSVPSLNVEMDLAPEGLSFRKPVALTLSYDHCNRAVLRNRSPYRIVYIDRNGTLHDRPSTDDKVERRVTASLDHFSRYAIAR